jgi:uncharacterized protein involved in cysteine biosynthesis
MSPCGARSQKVPPWRCRNNRPAWRSRMNDFSILDRLVVFMPLVVAIGLFVGLNAWLTHRSRNKYPGELKGVGGWLAWLAIAITVVPFAALLNLARDISELGAVITSPSIRLQIQVHLLLDAVYLITTVIPVIYMYRRSVKFPKYFIWCASLWIFFILCNAFIFAFIIAEVTAKTSIQVISQFYPPLIIVKQVWRVIVLVASIIYVARSKRVANTFVS